MKKSSDIKRRDALSLAAATAATAVMGLTPKPAQAETESMSISSHTIGNTEVLVLSDGPMHLGEAAQHYPNAPASRVNELVEQDGNPGGEFVIEQNCVLVRRGEKLTLIDTGVGPNPLFGPTTGHLNARLASAGIDRNQISDVILTHAHLDHAGGLIVEGGQPAFPNARIHVNQEDFNFWTDLNSVPSGGFLSKIVGGVADALLPLRDRIEFYKPGHEPVSGFVGIYTPGHTYGHCSIAITDGDQTALVAGDVLHHPMQLQQTDWHFSGDADPSLASKSRAMLLDLAASEDTAFLAFHFKFPGIGRIERQGSAYRFGAA